MTVRKTAEKLPRGTKHALYVLTCRESRKEYVGQTAQCKKDHGKWVSLTPTEAMMWRWDDHRYLAACVTAPTTPLVNAIRKYGPSAFDHTLLEANLTKREANRAERRWVKRKKTRIPHGYNVHPGGNSGRQVFDSASKSERTRQYWASLSPAEYEQRQERARAALTPENERKLRAAANRRTTAERRATSKRFWASMDEEKRAHIMARLQAGDAFARAHRTPEEQRQIDVRRRAGVLAALAATPRDELSVRWKRVWAKYTPTERSAIARKREEAMTDEQRRARAAKISAAQRRRFDAMTLEQRRALGRPLSREQLAAMHAGLAARTPEQRSKSAQLGWTSERRARLKPLSPEKRAACNAKISAAAKARRRAKVR